MKYLIATIALAISLAFGWLVSAKYLEPVILRFFNPESHERYLDIWFTIFVLIELVVFLTYLIYVDKLYQANKHLTKRSSGR